MRAVIFDLDGVLVSTDKYHYEAWKRLADRLHIPFDEKVNSRLRGVSRMESLSIILSRGTKRYSDTEMAELAEEKNDTYRGLLAQMTPEDVSSEVRGTIGTLREKGLLLAIGSSSKNTKYILERVGLIKEFDAISDGTNITRSKPDPEVFLMAADMLGVSPSEALVVEDAISGIDAAIAGNFPCAGIGDAAGHPRVMYPIGSIGELPEVVKNRG